MSHIDAVNELIDAINRDRFDLIEAIHNDDVNFHSFRGPILNDAVAVGDWHRLFHNNYADLTYTENEFVEEGDKIAVRTTFDAKGYDWRRFSQRAVDVFDLTEDGGVSRRRLYAMLRDIELDKASNSAYEYALETKGGSASGTKTVVTSFYDALFAGDSDAAKELIHDKCAVIDSIYGIAAGKDAIVEVWQSIPRPAFGSLRITNIIAGGTAALVEFSLDGNRPRLAQWVRVIEDKVAVVETYWMLREAGFNSAEEYRHDRHLKKVILPI